METDKNIQIVIDMMPFEQNPNIKPLLEEGWYMVIVKPVNWKSMDFVHASYDDWIARHGLDKVWYNNGCFWKEHFIITERVLYYAKCPLVNLK